MSKLQEKFKELEYEIEKAKLENRPIVPYVIEQITILEQSLNEFISKALKKGYKRNDIRIGEIEVKQYMIMSDLASKIGLSTDKYKERIKQAQIRVLGEDVYNAHFEE